MKNQARHFGRLRRAEMCTAYIFILPMFAGLLLFSIIPFIQNILYSFRKMGTFGEGTFIGLKNYQDLLKDDTFWLALQKCGCLSRQLASRQRSVSCGGGFSTISTASSTGSWRSWAFPGSLGWVM